MPFKDKYGHWRTNYGARIRSPRRYFNAVRRNRSTYRNRNRYNSYSRTYYSSRSSTNYRSLINYRYSNSNSNTLNKYIGSSPAEVAEIYGTTIEEVARDCGVPVEVVDINMILDWAGAD